MSCSGSSGVAVSEFATRADVGGAAMSPSVTRADGGGAAVSPTATRAEAGAAAVSEFATRADVSGATAFEFVSRVDVSGAAVFEFVTRTDVNRGGSARCGGIGARVDPVETPGASVAPYLQVHTCKYLQASTTASTRKQGASTPS